MFYKFVFVVPAFSLLLLMLSNNPPVITLPRLLQYRLSFSDEPADFSDTPVTAWHILYLYICLDSFNWDSLDAFYSGSFLKFTRNFFSKVYGFIMSMFMSTE